jgi:peptidoglycan/LPS O-acetylase OafA/YrhL
MNPAPAPAAGPVPRFWTLDALRGLCALVVFLSHWHLWSDFAPQGRVEQGIHATLAWCNNSFNLLAWPTGGNHPAVICFFVLSGFCIHYPFERRVRAGSTALDWREHYRRRFWRIMPVYWGAALLGLGLVAAEASHRSGNPLLALHSLASADEIAARLLGVYGIYPREILAGNYPLNTVAVEMVIYAVYPWFHFQAVRDRWCALGATFIGLQFAGLALLAWITPFWVFNSVLMLGVFWYAGAFAARVFVVGGTRSYARELLLAWLVFLALKAIPHFYGLNVLKQNAWGLVCTFGLLQCLHLEQARPAAAARPGSMALRYVGEVSYSLYVVHAPAIMLASWLLLRLGSANYLVQLTTTLALSLAATVAMHYGVERIFYRPRAGRHSTVNNPSSATAPTAQPAPNHRER